MHTGRVGLKLKNICCFIRSTNEVILTIVINFVKNSLRWIQLIAPVHIKPMFVDVCADDISGCSPDAICQVVNGAAVCTCNDGFAGDGKTCNPTVGKYY